MTFQGSPSFENFVGDHKAISIPTYFNVYGHPTYPKFLKFSKKEVEIVISFCK